MLTPSETRAREARERPIIFSAPMVRAILAGRKTQTRRIVKRPTDHFHASYTHLHREGERFVWSDGRGGCQRAARMPAQVGDRLWVKESWCPSAEAADQTHYAADGIHVVLDDGDGFTATNRDGSERSPWRSSIHMPRSRSRLTLEVTEVRVERLQDISCADAITEGIPPAANSVTIDCDTPDPREECRSLWNSIHGKDAWDANPWVAAITFRPLPASLESQKKGAAV